MQRVIPKLLTWYAENYRKLPWRETKNPYFIWISEIILQQTRVDQGMQYYFDFIDKYPKINDLAAAPEEQVLKTWQGLGYYARARNLHKAAKWVCDVHNGQFPDTFESILELPGVGDYTASAIASFAYNLPHAAVDGNVKRVSSRFWGIELPIDSNTFFKQIKSLLTDVIPQNEPGNFNQAMIELGATVCKPTQPDCESCPLQSECAAFLQKKTHLLPIAASKTKVKNVRLDYFFIDHREESLLYQRSSNGIWGGLYEFPVLQGLEEFSKEEMSAFYLSLEHLFAEHGFIWSCHEFEHKLSHRQIQAVFWQMKIPLRYAQDALGCYRDLYDKINLIMNKQDAKGADLTSPEKLKITNIHEINRLPLHKLMSKFVNS